MSGGLFGGSFVIMSPLFLLGVAGLVVLVVVSTSSLKGWRKVVVPCLLLAIIAGGILPAILPRHGRSRPPRISTTDNLKQIGLAIVMYALDNEGNVPPTLGKAFPYVGVGDVFVTHHSGTSKPRSGHDVDSGSCDLLYFGTGKTGGPDDGKVVVVTTNPKTATEEGYVCVVYLDGHVERHTSVPADIKALWDAYPNGKPPEVTPPDESVRSDESD
jgi:hypothetical protein